MRIAVIIVGYRNAGQIADCLEALAKSTYVEFDVYICENGGSKAYIQLVNTIPTKLPNGQDVHTFLAATNLGYAGGINLCLANISDASGYWIVNPDTLVDNFALGHLVSRMKCDDFDIVGGRLLNCDGTIQSDGGKWRAWCARSISINKGAPISKALSQSVVTTKLSFVSGASLLISASALDKLGPMREDYFLYCEEVEWCLRATALGLTLGFAEAALVHHSQGGTTGSGNDKSARPRLPIYLDERNKLNVVRDRSPSIFFIAAVLSLFALMYRYGALKSSRQLLFALQGWSAGLRGERHRPTWVEG